MAEIIVPIPYQRTFAAERLDKQKMTKTVNGEKLEYKVPIFDGNKGVECLMYVHESFESACARLRINTGSDKFDLFMTVLSESAKDAWVEVLRNTPINQRNTLAHFNTAFNKMIGLFTGSQARDQMIEALGTTTMKKPFNTSV